MDPNEKILVEKEYEKLFSVKLKDQNLEAIDSGDAIEGALKSDQEDIEMDDNT